MAGLDAAAAQTIRIALTRFGPQIASDALQLGGRTIIAGAAASAGPAIVNGRVTARGVELVVRKLASILESAPHLAEELRRARNLGAKFYPVVDDGLCLACSFTYNRIPRRFCMRMSDASDARQLGLFLKTCINGTQGVFRDPRASWFKYYGF
jgi:hypothetical protein